MKKKKDFLPEITLIGLTVRTNNKNEMDSSKSKIGDLAAYFWSQNIANNIKNRLNPGVTYCAYTDFENDENGEYTYFIGESVESLTDQDLSLFSTVSVPAGNFMKFTTEPGPMPGVVIDAWKNIWKMKQHEFEGNRSYIVDYEVYDSKAADLTNAVVDIYIGLE